jgi:hypothetical protein
LDGIEENSDNDDLLNEDLVDLIRDSQTDNLSAQRHERTYGVLPLISNMSILVASGEVLKAYFYKFFFLFCLLAFAIARILSK